MNTLRRVVLICLSARVERDEKDERWDALIFWWERQIRPHPGGVGRKGGGSAPLRCACAFWELAQWAVLVPTGYGTGRCAGQIFAGETSA